MDTASRIALDRARPLVGRLRAGSGPFIELSSSQIRALAALREKIGNGSYGTARHPCLCGETIGVLVGLVDRYGLDVRTVLCRRCGLMRTDPYFDQDAIGRFYNEDYLPIYAVTEKPVDDWFARQTLRGKKILDALREWKIDIASPVIEIGCGFGGVLASFQTAGYEVLGCDLSRRAIAAAQERGIPVRLGGAGAVMQEGRAQTIILSHVLEHFPDPLAELRHIRSLLSNAGLLVIEVPGILSIESAYRGNIALFLQNAHAYHFCLSSLDFVLGLAGFARVAGDERIIAVYRPSENSATPPRDLPRHLVGAIKKMERRRRVTALKSLARRAVRVVVGPPA